MLKHKVCRQWRGKPPINELQVAVIRVPIFVTGHPAKNCSFNCLAGIMFAPERLHRSVLAKYFGCRFEPDADGPGMPSDESPANALD